MEEAAVVKYITPDGSLIFLVFREKGDVTLGFEGYPWHTHGDILAALTGLNVENAVSQFVDDLLHGRSIIAIATVDGGVRDVWVVDNLDGVERYKPDNETITLRYWDGATYPNSDADTRAGDVSQE